MPDDFRPVFQALSDATQELIKSHKHLVGIGEALLAATTATQHARDEGNDVKETVHRLERLIEDLIRRQGDKS